MATIGNDDFLLRVEVQAFRNLIVVGDAATQFEKSADGYGRRCCLHPTRSPLNDFSGGIKVRVAATERDDIILFGGKFHEVIAQRGCLFAR